MFVLKKTKHKFLIISILSIFIIISIIFSIVYEKKPYATWKTPFLPLVITVDETGIRIAEEVSIVTPMGTFAAGYSSNLLQEAHKNLMLVIKDQEKERVYEIDSNQKLYVFVNGTTLIEAQNNVVIIDATKSKKLKIQLSPTENPFEKNKDTIVPIKFNVLTRENNGERFTKLNEGDSIKDGSKIKINFTVAKQAYVYIYNIKPTGLSQRLFPESQISSSSTVRSNPITANQTIYLPSNQESYEVEQDDDNDELYFIALNKKDEDLEKGNSNIATYINTNYGFYFNTISFKIR
jgi:hypothetical protein